MKPNLVPILCGTALAIMAGAAASHFSSVRQMIMLADAGLIPTSTAPGLSAPETSSDSDTRAMIAEIRRQNSLMQDQLDGDPAPAFASSSSGSGNLERILAELVATNRDLRSQLAETNRDIMELRFQVDSHSEQFRPLNAVEEPDYGVDPLYDSNPYGNEPDSDSIGVLPPLDLP